MATTSIKKQFIAKDIKTFNTLAKEVENAPTREVKVSNPSSLKRGTELLKQFSFH